MFQRHVEGDDEHASEPPKLTKTRTISIHQTGLWQYVHRDLYLLIPRGLWQYALRKHQYGSLYLFILQRHSTDAAYA